MAGGAPTGAGGLVLVAPPEHDEALAALLARVKLPVARVRTGVDLQRVSHSAPPLAIVVDLGLRDQDPIAVCAEAVGLIVAPVIIVYEGASQRNAALLRLRQGVADIVPLDEDPELAAVRIETALNRWRER